MSASLALCLILGDCFEGCKDSGRTNSDSKALRCIFSFNVIVNDCNIVIFLKFNVVVSNYDINLKNYNVAVIDCGIACVCRHS